MNSLKLYYNRYKKNIIIILTSVLFFIGLVNFYFIFDITPQPNDECIWREGKDENGNFVYIFEQVKFEGVTWNAGIRDGDYLLEIEGVRAINATVANRALLSAENGFAEYKVSRNGNVFTTEVEVKRLIQFGGLAFILLSFIWLIVGHIVVMAKPFGKVQTVFYRIGAALVLFSMFNLQNYASGDNPIQKYIFLTLLVDHLQTLGSAFAPFLILQFFMLFPRKLKIMDKKGAEFVLYIIPWLIFTLFMLYKYFFVYGDFTKVMMFYAVYQAITAFLMLILAIFGTILLFRGYLKLTDPKERSAVFTIFIGMTFGIASIIYTATIANVIADNIYNSPYYFAPIIFVAVIPVTFGYAVFRYSLMDITDVVKNAILYATATVSLAGIYFLVIYIAGQQISAAIGTEYQSIIAGLVFIGFAMIFQNTRNKFQSYITQKFYPEQFASQKMLLRFSNDVYGIVGLENILNFSQQTFVEALKIQRFGIMLVSQQDDRLELRRNSGFRKKYFELSPDFPVLEKLLSDKKHAGQHTVFDHHDFTSVFGSGGSVLQEEKIYTVIPLIIKSRVIGLLLLGLKYSGAQFTDKDFGLLVAAANQIAVSIENARLYESEVEKKQLERDLDNARKIQESLLPKRLPVIKKASFSGIMIPAMHIGGDYYDIIKLSDEKLFVIVGDVSGKGLAASFYMSKLQTMVRMYAAEFDSPAGLMKKINSLLYHNIEKNWFITATVGLFDLAGMELKFCRAGHAPLAFYGKERSELIKPGGIGLGLEGGKIFDSTLVEFTIKLESEDIIVFYSDGLSESMNLKKKFFGDEEILKIIEENNSLTSQELEENILEKVEAFRGNAVQNDDITLVTVKIN